jgi:hypothetical protein
MIYLIMPSVGKFFQGRMILWLTKNELEWIWRNAVVADFKALSVTVPGSTKKTMENSCQRGRCPGVDLNLEPPKCKAAVLTTFSHVR